MRALRHRTVAACPDLDLTARIDKTMILISFGGPRILSAKEIPGACGSGEANPGVVFSRVLSQRRHRLAFCGFEMSAAVEWIALDSGADVFTFSRDQLQ